MPRAKRLSVNDVITILENDMDFWDANIYICPPNDPNCSDSDSGDEEFGTIHNLSRCQLEADGEATLRTGPYERERIGEPQESELDQLATHTSNESRHSTHNDSSVPPVDLSVPATARLTRRLKRGYETDTPAESTSAGLSKQSTIKTVAKSVPDIPEVAKKRSKQPQVPKLVIPSAIPTAEKLVPDAVPEVPGMRIRSNQPRVPKPARHWVKKDIIVGTNMASSIRNQHADSDLTPTVLFEKFFGDDVIKMLVERTNKYARIEKNKPIFETSIGEMRLFVAILFTSGYAPLPRRRLYWESADDVKNAAISGAMTRNRFDELIMCLHVSDNEHLAANDRMAKVRPLFDALNLRFLAEFPRSQNQLSIDESMVPYYGRHSAKQFIRGKPIRFGFKVWSINTPLGYCIQLDPYQGAGVTDSQLGLGGSVVAKLADCLPPAAEKYTLYFDNFFTGLNLLHFLSGKNILATGTVRANRVDKCPLLPVDKMKKADRGTYDYRLDSTTGIIVTRWNDNSVVTLASNCHGIAPLGTAKRWSRTERKFVDISQPYVIDRYNRHMGGVDRMDQNISTYRISIRSKKWWWALFAYLLDVAMQNAWILYRHTAAATQRPLDQLDFRRDICTVYYKRYSGERASIGRPLGRPKAIKGRVPSDIRTDGINHFLESSGTQRRCGVCGLKTRRICRKCDIGLHQECLASFHQ